MTATTYYASDVLRAMKEVVAEAGKDYVYPADKTAGMCYYRAPDRPECLVGRVLRRLVPDFTPQEHLSAWDHRDELRDHGFHPLAVLCLQMAQTMQDRGHTWRAALEAAKAIPDVIRAWRGVD